MDGVGDVLVYAPVAPEYPLGIGVFAVEGADALGGAHAPSSFSVAFDGDGVDGPAVSFGVVLAAPAADVVGASHYARLHALGDPHFIHEVTDIGVHFHQVAGLYAETACVVGVHPDRVAVGDFSEPFGVAGAGVDERRKAEGGHQHELPFAFVQGIEVDMAFDVLRDDVFGPFPVGHGLGVELIFSGRRREAHAGFAVHHDADGVAVFGDHPGDGVGGSPLQLCFAQGFFIFEVAVFFDLEGAVFFHVVQFAQALFAGCFRQAGHVFEDELVVLVHGDFLAGPVGRQEVLPDAEAAVGVYAPGELDPELVFFPHFAGVGFIGEGHGLAVAAGGFAQHRLPEGDPGAGMCFVAVDVVALRGQAHGEHIIREIGGFAPGGGQGGV